MQDEQDLTPAQRELETALASLKGARPVIDRDQLLYQAGLAAGRSAYRRWAAAATAAAVVLAAVLAVVAAFPRDAGERIVYVRRAAAKPDQPRRLEPWTVQVAPGEAPRAEYLHLRTEVLAKGLGALPPAASRSGDGETNEEYRRLLARPAAVFPGQLMRLWNFFRTGDES
jgi:hypothetical protein